MIQRHKRFFIFLAVIVGSSFLSACSGIQSPPSSTAIDQSSISNGAGNNDPYSYASAETDPETCAKRGFSGFPAFTHRGNAERSANGQYLDLKVNSDFPLTMNDQVRAYIDYFQNDQRKLFSYWLSRSKQYIPMMQKELKSAGLPTDLAYLAMIESGFNQKACSSAQAIGLWQFMNDTGRQYNLRIDGYVDERFNAEKSTKAAVSLLGNLYQEFGDWNLAVAAYNAGPNKISTGLKKYNVDNFWDLAQKPYLSQETKSYVPELIAAIIIAKNPERFGFTDIEYANPPSYETLEVGPGLGLDGVALLTNSSKKEIQHLNQELIAGKTPPSDHKFRIKIPAGTKEAALSNLPRLRSSITTEYKYHVVGHHETFLAVCNKYHISRSELLKANHFKKGKMVPGQHLRIPIASVRYHLMNERTETIAQTNHKPVHGNVSGDAYKWIKIENGDTLWAISQKFNTSPDQIKDWNNLKSDALHPGDKLKVKKPDSIIAERSDNTML